MHDLKGMLNQVKLTPEQAKKWSDTKVALLWHAPAFAHIFYTMMDKAGSEYQAVMIDNEEILYAATDGTSLILNASPTGFFTFNLYERVFVCVHEILHVIMDHPGLMWQLYQQGKVKYPDGRELKYSPMMLNAAADYIINDIVIDSKIGEMPKEGLHDPSIGNRTEDVLSVYAKLYKQYPPRKGGSGGGGGGGGYAPPKKGFDKHLKPGTTTGKTADKAVQERKAEAGRWKTELAAAAQTARLQGKLPAGLERLFKELLEPQVDWREKIQGLFARRVGGGGYNWRKPDRRLIIRDIYAPARSGFGAGTVVVAGDTSGSITDKEVDMFFGEMAGILEDVRPQRLAIVWCDARVNRVDECSDGSDLNHIRYKGAPGGGGTSFIPVFDWIKEQGITPDALVYLTDGEGSFPQEVPSYPVIWGNINPGYKYPFGDVVDIPKVR